MGSYLQKTTSQDLSLFKKFLNINWTFVLFICLIVSVGIAMLYSAAEGNFNPWASRQLLRFCVGLMILFTVALVDVRVWLSSAYAIYVIALIFLVGVEIKGEIGMGAQRWIDLGIIQLQPSEMMKVALVLALARYFHRRSLEEIQRIPTLIAPIFMTLCPVALVLKQPDLGTAMMLFAGAIAMFFVAGVRWWKFVVVGILGAIAVPVAWGFLHDYQKLRVLTFLDPTTDPLGAGYHIIQSKIAFGSGGILGKGFLQGTQSHLSFLPEKQTDFIFTMIAEEFGFLGGMSVLILYGCIIAYGLMISLQCQNQFGRLLGIGATFTFFLYVFINIAMVMGLIPVVGVPLPLISYGGTAMLTLMFSFGLLMSVYIHRDIQISRYSSL